MLRNVYLEGELGNKFIPHFEIDCDTPAAAIRCIDANFPDFKQYMLQKGEEGVMYHLDVAGHEIEYGEELLMEMKEGDITLIPVPAGSKSGIGKLLLAAVIITAAFYMPTLMTYTQPLATPGATTAAGVSGGVTVQGNLAAAMTGAMGKTVAVVANMAVGMATNLAIAGLQQIMAPDPSTDADQEQSYLFNGSEQNIVEGDPVPILYGRLRVPGQPIGFEVLSGDLQNSEAVIGPDGETLLTNQIHRENQVAYQTLLSNLPF